MIFGRSLGKISALAKGARKANSKLKASVQPFCYSRLQVRPPGKSARAAGGLWIVTQGETIEALPQLREDLGRIACASYVGEMMDLVLPEEKPQESLFILSVAALTLLANTETAAQTYLPLRYFELRLLAELGWRPRFDICARCGHSVSGGWYVAAPERGGLLCADCCGALAAGQLPPKAERLSAGAVMVLERLLNWDLRRLFNLRISEPLRQETEACINAFLDFHIGRGAAKARENLHLYI